MTKPREWWIDVVEAFGQTNDPIGEVYCGPKYDDLIHVIEHSAYCDLKAKLDEVDHLIPKGMVLDAVIEERNRLKAENRRLVFENKRLANSTEYDRESEKSKQSNVELDLRNGRLKHKLNQLRHEADKLAEALTKVTIYQSSAINGLFRGFQKEANADVRAAQHCANEALTRWKEFTNGK